MYYKRLCLYYASISGGARLLGPSGNGNNTGGGGAQHTGGGGSDAATRGDVQPMAIEAGGGGSKVGGLDDHVKVRALPGGLTP